MDKLDEAPAPAVNRPWWLGAAIIAIGLFWVYGATLLPQTSGYAKVGPGMFVTLAGLGLIFFGAVLLFQIARGERFEAQEGEDVVADKPTSWPALFTALAAGLIPIYAMQRFGFVPTATLVFALTARAFGSVRLPFDLAVGLLVGGLSWYGFTLLGVGLGPAAKLPGLLELLPSLKPY